MFKNLYSIGTHNGNSEYSFTTFESALTNALHSLHEIAPESKSIFPISSPLSLDIIIKYIVLGLILVILVYKIIY